MKELKSSSEFNEFISQEKATCVVFTADWCKDCIAIKPFMPQIAESYSQQLDFAQIDPSEFEDIREDHDVLGIPSFIIFEGGEEIGRFVSKDHKTQAEIRSFIDSTLGN